jgi:hypothetical protein
MKITKTFGSVEYQGNFRDYQRHLLRRMEDRLDESKINLITPPGSGKTVLGLEIIKRMSSPCLILTSTESIRNHWSETFTSRFLPESERAHAEEYVSYRLENPALITAVTYRDLSEVISAQRTREEADRKAAEEAERMGIEHVAKEDEGLNVIHLVQEHNISTILLDEAHHLSDRYMTALEAFLGVLGGEIRVLSMTAIPPYDLSAESWNRYVTLCGEFTDEICVPELVKTRALCPHRDLIYFNYPTEGESEDIRGHRLRVDQAIKEAAGLGFMSELNRRLTKISAKHFGYLYSHRSSAIALFTLLHEYGHMINVKLYRHLTGRKQVKPLTLPVAQEAFYFLLESQTILHDHEKDQLLNLFSRYRLVEHNHAQLVTTEKIRRIIRSSTGKLAGIADITAHESAAMGDNLREVVLVDFADLDGFQQFGSPEIKNHVTMASIFSVITEKTALTDVACLCHTTAVLPVAVRKALEKKDLAFTTEPVPHSELLFCTFSDQATAVEAVTDLFREGVIRVLIGCAEDLSDGWNDTFVNTLILTACGSTLVEGNRIRGRVIHACEEDPHKTAHIWHLVTIERNYDLQQYPEMRLASRQTDEASDITSVDYRMLCNRFDCFVGPNTASGELENGIERLNAIRPPFNEEGFKQINQAMLDNTATRAELGGIWDEATRENTRPVSEVRIPERARVPVMTAPNVILLILATACLIVGLSQLPTLILFTYLAFLMTPDISWLVAILLLIDIFAIIWGVVFIVYMLPLLINHLFGTASIRAMCKALMKAMKELGLVGKEAELVMEPLKKDKSLRIYLDNCTHSEQIEFQKALAEMYTPIDSPRYIMVRAGWFNRLLWKWSFACPSIIGKTDISVKVFAKHMRMSMGPMKFQYTRRELGRKYLMLAQNYSYVNQRGLSCEKRLHLLKRDRT